jgi:hypothetical protein
MTHPFRVMREKPSEVFVVHKDQSCWNCRRSCIRGRTQVDCTAEGYADTNVDTTKAQTCPAFKDSRKPLHLYVAERKGQD